jgi:serine/threonine-protein kinase
VLSFQRFDLAMKMRQPDAALEAIANAPEWLANRPTVLLRGQALARQGDDGGAAKAFREARRLLEARLPESSGQADLQSDLQYGLSIAHAGLGDREAALRTARRATELLPISQDSLIGGAYLTQLARIEAQVGETDSALEHLRQLLAAPAGDEVSAATLRLDPDWDPLRQDPRFERMIAEAETTTTQAAP